MSDKTSDPQITDLLLENENLVTRHTKRTFLIFFMVLVAHLTLSAFVLIFTPSPSPQGLAQFIAFNVTVLFVELLLARMGFIQGARVGQLREMRIALLAASQPIDLAKVEVIARALMLLRRASSESRLLDIEKCFAALRQDKK